MEIDKLPTDNPAQPLLDELALLRDLREVAAALCLLGAMTRPADDSPWRAERQTALELIVRLDTLRTRTGEG